MKNKELKGIEGWLLILGIGLIIGLFSLLLNIFNQYVSFSGGEWDQLITQGTEYYHRLWYPALIYSFVSTVILVVFCSYVAYLFFHTSPKFPRRFIILIVASLFFTIGELAIYSSIPNVSDETMAGLIKDLMRAIFSGAIWGAYVLGSKRVKNTFVEIKDLVA